jgi:hypothetical protein
MSDEDLRWSRRILPGGRAVYVTDEPLLAGYYIYDRGYGGSGASGGG